jgi:HK97 family phage major capsid protein
MDINDLRRQREALKAEASALLSREAVSDEDMATAEAKLADADKVEARIRLLDRAQSEDQAAPLETPDRQANQGRPFGSLGEQLRAIAAASTPTSPQVDRRLYAVKAATGLSENVPSDGGFLVQPDLISGLLQRVYEGGEFISRCRQYTVGANSDRIVLPYIDETSRADGSRAGGVRGYWEDEADDAAASKPKFGRLEIVLNELKALCYASDRVLADAAALQSVIETAFPEELRFKLQDAVIRGDGSGKPLGVLNSSALVSVAKEDGQSADTVLYENIVKMWSRLWAPSRRSAVWFINQDVEPQLYSMSIAVGTGGIPVYLPANGLAGQPYGTLFGRPVIAIEHADTVGDQGDILLADPSQYGLATKGGIQAASSIHVQFIYSETTFRFIYRVGGQPLWKSTLTPFQSTSTLAPFVALDARA